MKAGLGCKVKLYVFTYKKLSVPSRQYYSDIWISLVLHLMRTVSVDTRLDILLLRETARYLRTKSTIKSSFAYLENTLYSIFWLVLHGS